ncbi:MAG: glutamate--cysteine ligase, partial [Rhodobiaceae bacterium]
FWVGLLYDAETQSKLVDYIADWTQTERDALRLGAPQTGLATPFRGGTLLDMAREIVPMAAQGLKNRARGDGAGADESLFLAYLEEIVESGKSSAEKLLDKYHGEWGGDLKKAYQTLTL